MGIAIWHVVIFWSRQMGFAWPCVILRATPMSKRVNGWWTEERCCRECGKKVLVKAGIVKGLKWKKAGWETGPVGFWYAIEGSRREDRQRRWRWVVCAEG